MRWPRGRYNGERIVGVVVKVRIDITRWRLERCCPWYFPWYVCVGPLHVWLEPAYEER